MRRLVLLSILAACGGQDPSLAGEGCVRTVQCALGLACVAGTCSTDLTGIMGELPINPDVGPALDGAVDAPSMMDAGPGMDVGPGMDAGRDTGPMDAGRDAGPMDAGPMDAGPMDAGPMDAGPMDAGPMDAGPMDAGPMDAGPMDAGPMDAG